MVFTTWYASVKARNIRREPRVSLCVDNEEPPFAFVLIEGTVRISERDPDLGHGATRIAGRYMGEGLAGDYEERNSVEGELLLRVTPDKIVAR